MPRIAARASRAPVLCRSGAGWNGSRPASIAEGDAPTSPPGRRNRQQVVQGVGQPRWDWWVIAIAIARAGPGRSAISGSLGGAGVDLALKGGSGQSTGTPGVWIAVSARAVARSVSAATARRRPLRSAMTAVAERPPRTPSRRASSRSTLGVASQLRSALHRLCDRSSGRDAGVGRVESPRSRPRRCRARCGVWASIDIKVATAEHRRRDINRRSGRSDWNRCRQAG